MACPKCGKPWMRIEGNTLKCGCGYETTLPEKKPTYDELKARILTLELFVEAYLDNKADEATYIKEAKKLMEIR